MKKKILTAVIAIVAVCALFATGTLAYLTATTDESGVGIVNTFVASDGLIDPVDEDDESTKDNGFFIKETQVGSESSKTTTGNEYVVMPSVPITKDARFIIKGKTDVKSYAFLKVTDTLATGLSWAIDTNNWILLEDIECADGEDSKIYVYNSVVDEDIDGAVIVVDDKINVADDFALSDGETDAGSLSFLGFLCQEASFEAKAPEGTETEAGNYKAAATKAFKACFKDQVAAETK